MKRNTAFFSCLYNLSYTFFILLCINLCVSLHGLADSWRWILLGWGFAGLATKYLADQGAAGSGIYGHTLPLAPLPDLLRSILLIKVLPVLASMAIRCRLRLPISMKGEIP